MKIINFVPESIRAHNSHQRLVAATVLAALLGAAAVGVFWISLRTTVNATQTSHSAASPSPTPSSSASAQPKDITTRITTLNTLGKTDINWSRTFALVDNLIPKDTTLSTYVLAQDASNNVTLQFGGVAPSNLSFASFWQSLQNGSDLVSVKSNSYTYDAAKGTVSFSISGQIPTNKIDFSAP